ncbi:MAG: DUF2927 domain-containing protein [Pseudomonadota bacterium]
MLPLLMLLCGCVPATHGDLPSRTAFATEELPPMKAFAAIAPPPQRMVNAHLIEDFLELSFYLESGRPVSTFTRFEGPISLRVSGRPSSTLERDLDGLLSRLEAEAGITITRTDSPRANITIDAVSRRDIQRVLPNAACFVVPNATSLSDFRSKRRNPKTNWATLKERRQLVIVLPNDVSPQEVRDCLHEELAQALGPLNDLYRLPNSVFNDDNVHTVLTDFDMLILRATYAPELATGMSQAEVARRLPAIFTRENPKGALKAHARKTATPRAYVDAIQMALGPGADVPQRQEAALRAVEIAAAEGWVDARRGFAYYALGRVLQSTNPDAALEAFLRADRYYARSSATRLHRAYVAAQLGAHALVAGDTQNARARVTPMIEPAKRAQNAALLATLQLVRAETLRADGRLKEAQALRLDSLGWARYGFGSDGAVEAKQREIANLNRPEPPV